MPYLSDELNGTHLKRKGTNRGDPQVSIHREYDKPAHVREGSHPATQWTSSAIRADRVPRGRRLRNVCWHRPVWTG